MKEEGKISKSDLDYIANQLKQTQNETAATIALQPARAVQRQQKVQSVRSSVLPSLIGIAVSLVILLAGYAYLQKEETLKSATVIKRIEKLATLATARAHMETTLSDKDNKLFGKDIPFGLDIPGSKRTLFMVVPGEVTAGVDLKNLTKKDIALDTKKKTIHITLPPATFVQAPSIDSKNILKFSDEGLFRSEPNWDEGFKLEDIAKQKMEKEARQNGLLTEAEMNARLALQDIFEIQGYSVTVTFK
ncbi:hypothetical protein DRW41_03520 [Neobacillus piezotolerans]|uniref:DUF4230 domain-containing protein n=1 Tax=Neobacillus piezotolerans TaxID=2259171 RepID=A0A3D8GW05_9BACI|nr:DUF4230 domain-containing protein [Neobacillus piezotolerans]RDU38643.1 hypothetical protein DRW41_03520 [Neobacillus piezotolerans]